MRNLKYLCFTSILILTGIIFFHREELWTDFSDMIMDGANAYDISDNNVPLSGVSGNDLSGNDLSGGDISGGDVSGGNVSGGDISGGNGALGYYTVEQDYFDDALFIGDSRTVGLSEYAGLDNSTFYASTGLTIYKLFDAEIVPVEGSRTKQTIEAALSEKQFSKIYLMIGINEMGTGTVDTFIAAYQSAVEHLQELQPNAVIYLQAIMRVSTDRSAQGDYITNVGIDERNRRIAELADDQKVFFLDVNPLVCDEDGGLVADYTFDGVHLRAAYISIWKEFLMEHAILY